MTENKPVKTFRSGGLSVTVWENPVEVKGIKSVMKSFQIQKRYKKDGDWETSKSYNVNDLPRIQVLINKAYEYATIKDDTDNIDD